MKPIRQGPEFSTATALSVSSLPRRTRPSRFTHSYSDARVKRRALGKENEPPVLIVDLLTKMRVRTAKVFSRRLSGEDFARVKEEMNLRTGRRRSRRLRCRCRRLRCRCRTSCFSGCGRTRGSWACRGRGCFGLLLARREECGTGQDTDVFFHSVNWKRHIALTDQSEQDSF
jgi:hypothetical protein